MKKFLNKYFLVLLLKYVALYTIQFSQGADLQVPTLEGLMLAVIVLMVLPIVDLLFLAWPTYWIVTKVEQANNRLWLIGMLTICTFEVYLTMLCSQHQLMDWHIWKGVISLLLFSIIFRETLKTEKSKHITPSTNS